MNKIIVLSKLYLDGWGRLFKLVSLHFYTFTQLVYRRPFLVHRKKDPISVLGSWLHNEVTNTFYMVHILLDIEIIV